MFKLTRWEDLSNLTSTCIEWLSNQLVEKKLILINSHISTSWTIEVIFPWKEQGVRMNKGEKTKWCWSYYDSCGFYEMTDTVIWISNFCNQNKCACSSLPCERSYRLDPLTISLVGTVSQISLLVQYCSMRRRTAFLSNLNLSEGPISLIHTSTHTTISIFITGFSVAEIKIQLMLLIEEEDDSSIDQIIQFNWYWWEENTQMLVIDMTISRLHTYFGQNLQRTCWWN